MNAPARQTKQPHSHAATLNSSSVCLTWHTVQKEVIMWTWKWKKTKQQQQQKQAQCRNLKRDLPLLRLVKLFRYRKTAFPEIKLLIHKKKFERIIARKNDGEQQLQLNI